MMTVIINKQYQKITYNIVTATEEEHTDNNKDNLTGVGTENEKVVINELKVILEDGSTEEDNKDTRMPNIVL